MTERHFNSGKSLNTSIAITNGNVCLDLSVWFVCSALLCHIHLPFLTRAHSFLSPNIADTLNFNIGLALSFSIVVVVSFWLLMTPSLLSHLSHLKSISISVLLSSLQSFTFVRPPLLPLRDLFKYWKWPHLVQHISTKWLLVSSEWSEVTQSDCWIIVLYVRNNVSENWLILFVVCSPPTPLPPPDGIDCWWMWWW